MQIIRLEQSDFSDVLLLNESSVPHVNSIGSEELQWFTARAAFVRVARIDRRFAGFLIGLRPGSDYASLNYRWFCENYDDFAYVDRVAVAAWARRRGVAECLYNAFANSQSDVGRMTCEVNIRPPNDASMRFHERMGFRQVGSQKIGNKKVAFMEKTLCR